MHAHRQRINKRFSGFSIAIFLYEFPAQLNNKAGRAIIIINLKNNFIKATRVVLPINNQSKISVKYGLRHRAAVSITEKTDAVAIVVSEENGKISYIKNGKFIEFVSVENLTKLIEKDLS